MKILLAALCVASPALAEEPPEPFDASDRVWAGLSAVGAGLVLAVPTGLVVSAIERAADDGDDEWAGLAGFIIGLPIGFTLGSALGAYAYGELSGHDGAYWQALAGASVGFAGALGVFALLIEVNPDSDLLGGVVAWSALTLMPIGAVMGYELGLEDGPPPSGAQSARRPLASPTGRRRSLLCHSLCALVDYHPVAGLRLSVPFVAVGAHDGFQLAVPVLGGRF